MPIQDAEFQKRGGVVASLHLHPLRSGEPMRRVDQFTAVKGKGIQENGRYFGRVNRAGKPSRRQITLIEREQINTHADSLGLPEIAPGDVRANVETEGASLIGFLGKQVRIGTAVIRIYEARTPCSKMDAIAPGLRELMENSQQGVLAEIVESGVIRVGDAISILEGE